MPERKPAEAGLAGDPALFKLLTEIDIIAHLAATAFERLLPEGLTRAQFGVLNHLLRLDAQETVSELASAFQVAQPTMSSTVKRLASKGFVEFIPDTDDRRVKRVKVTRKGAAMRQKAVKAVAPHLAAVEHDAKGQDWAKLLPKLMKLRVFLDERR